MITFGMASTMTPLQSLPPQPLTASKPVLGPGTIRYPMCYYYNGNILSVPELAGATSRGRGPLLLAHDFSLPRVHDLTSTVAVPEHLHASHLVMSSRTSTRKRLECTHAYLRPEVSF